MVNETIDQSNVAVPKHIDERVIAAAEAYGQAIPQIVKAAGKVVIQEETHQGYGNYFHA